MNAPGRAPLVAAGLLWVAALAAGSAFLFDYANRPGAAGAIPSRWPDPAPLSGGLARPAGNPVLLLFAHPGCPCTQATLAELARIMAREREEHGLRAEVLFFKPAAAPDDWAGDGLRRAAATIPGVAVAADPDGREAMRFGAETSGQALLYDADGRLLFRGGLTASRGHEGDNAGEDAVRSLLAGRAAAAAGATPVFGCPILSAVP